MEEAHKTYVGLEDRLKEIRGGNLTLIDIIAESLTKEQIEEYSTAFIKKKAQYMQEAQKTAQKENPKPRPSMAGDTVDTSIAG
jgi:hypothetical protein